MSVPNQHSKKIKYIFVFFYKLSLFIRHQYISSRMFSLALTPHSPPLFGRQQVIRERGIEPSDLCSPQSSELITCEFFTNVMLIFNSVVF